jgi:site-specific DNA-methyltransferase (adenine-specific)
MDADPAALRPAERTIGPHLLLHGDCLAVMADLPAASVDVVVTSPPYNLDIAYGSYRDRKDEAEYLDWMVEVARAVRRLMKPDASFFLNISGSSSQPWLPFELIVRLRQVFALQNHMTWVKSIAIGQDGVGHYKPVRGDRFLHHTHEHVFHLTLSGDVALDRLAIGVPFADKSNIARRGHPQDLRCRGNAWFIPYRTVRSKAQKYNHPGTFPIDLPRWCIRLHGRPGGTVLDPFAGTGTTLVAAALENTRGIGIEIDPSYVEVATTRLHETLNL